MRVAPAAVDVATTSADRSLWLDGAARAAYPPLADAAVFDVAVLGGGITGLTVATLLKRSGARVAVIEAREIGHGVTGCTTAKVSALQSTILSSIEDRHGRNSVAAYAAASAAGVALVAELAEDLSIDCDLLRQPAATYAFDSDDSPAVEREYDLARGAGLAVELVDRLDLPFPIASAVTLADQIAFHPVRYVEGLARALVEGGDSRVFEQTRALRVSDGSPCVIETDRTQLRAERVVDATHYPMLDRGLFFARLKAQRSYAIAARVTSGAVPSTMAISAGETTRSVRGFGDQVLVGGEGHPVGSSKAEPQRFEVLERFAREHWDIGEVAHRWSAQDPISYDHLPVIGPYPRSSRVFLASGFMKWGLSSAGAAAIVLSDLLAGRKSEWTEIFSPNRLSVGSAHEFALNNAKVARDMVLDRVRPSEAPSAESIPRGEARVIRDRLGKTGMYRDDVGDLHAVSLRCTHLGCLLRFNAAERSWDCSCHGSRFDVDGAVLEGPATRPLESRTV